MVNGEVNNTMPSKKRKKNGKGEPRGEGVKKEREGERKRRRKARTTQNKPVIFTIPWTTASEYKLVFLLESLTG